MKNGIFGLVVVIAFMAPGPVTGDEETEGTWDESTGDWDEGGIDCEELSEKIEIFVTLQGAVNRDFASVTDSKLCRVMTDQCEHFSRVAKNLQKEYRRECDREYEIIEIAECDYEANPCHRVPASYNPATANLRRKTRADPLSLVTGVYDVRTLSQ